MTTALACVSIAVQSLEDAIGDFKKLGFEPMGPVHESELGFALRWQAVGNETGLVFELIAPIGDDGPIARFLRREGEGVYQVRLVTSELDGVVNGMEGRGVRVVRPPAEDQGGLAGRIAWVHPSCARGVLLELVETDE